MKIIQTKFNQICSLINPQPFVKIKIAAFYT
jgi:hypothetical protein